MVKALSHFCQSRDSAFPDSLEGEMTGGALLSCCARPFGFDSAGWSPVMLMDNPHLPHPATPWAQRQEGTAPHCLHSSQEGVPDTQRGVGWERLLRNGSGLEGRSVNDSPRDRQRDKETLSLKYITLKHYLIRAGRLRGRTIYSPNKYLLSSYICHILL